jgi:putative hemolysin
MPPVSTLFTILIVLFCFSAFFSASEAALISLNKIRLRHWVENKKSGAKRVYGLISRMDQLIATILVGNNLVNTAIAAIATTIFTQMLGPGPGLLAATLIITVILIIFGELTPKVFATNHPEHVAFFGRHLVSLLIFILTPVTNVLTWISNSVIRLMGGNPHHRSPLMTEEELKMMIKIGREQGYYGDTERKMLERIFHFDEIEIRDVMTPLVSVAAVEVSMDQEEIEKIFMEEGHNRIPVYQGVTSNIIGVIYVRDLLYLFKNSELIHLEDLMSAPFFVEPHIKVNELLKEFLRKKLQIAIVRDETTGKALGLVTLEDLIEEIVGEIEEEIDASLTK